MRNPCSTPVDFWNRVDVKDADVCWNWTGCTNRGYGDVGYQKKHYRAHRLAWELTYGPVPDITNGTKTVIRHTCNNKLCCNPMHLIVGSQKDNIHDMLASRQHPRAKLLPTDVDRIREMLASGDKSQGEIGRTFGVHKSTISLIATGKHWKNYGGSQWLNGNVMLTK